jgi:hypothetical protein
MHKVEQGMSWIWKGIWNGTKEKLNNFKVNLNHLLLKTGILFRDENL